MVRRGEDRRREEMGDRYHLWGGEERRGEKRWVMGTTYGDERRREVGDRYHLWRREERRGEVGDEYHLL
jgi:hypothetical protein